MKHCWHTTERSTLTGGMHYVGHDTVKCCNCGMTGVRSWRDELVQEEGHGPFHKAHKRVNGLVTYANVPIPEDCGGVKRDPLFFLDGSDWADSNPFNPDLPSTGANNVNPNP